MKSRSVTLLILIATAVCGAWYKHSARGLPAHLVEPADATGAPPERAEKAAAESGIVALAPGIQPPGPESSATEKFLYQLATATASYCLDAAYRPGFGNNVLNDSAWALWRGQAVALAMESPLRTQIPAPLRSICLEALGLDAMLQATARSSDNATTSAKDDMRDIFIKGVRKLPALIAADESREESSDAIGNALFQAAESALLRAMRTEQMFNAFVALKKQGDFHQRWALLLGRLAKDDPALRPYAQDPRVTDPTWHFMRSRVAGDVFFGESFSSRAREDYAVDKMPHRKMNAGSLAEAPIEIAISRRGMFAVDVTYDIPSGKGGPILVGSCSRGHFAFRAGDDNPWVARGLSDSQHRGRMDHSRNTRGGRASVTLMHLPTTGKGEDLEAQGSLLIYLRSQAPSDEAARQIARRVSL